MRVRIMAEPGDGAIRVLTRNNQGQESEHVTITGGRTAEVEFDGDHEIVISTGGREPGQAPLQIPPTPVLLGGDDDGEASAVGYDVTALNGEETVQASGGDGAAAADGGADSVNGGGEDSAAGGGDDSLAGGGDTAAGGGDSVAADGGEGGEGAGGGEDSLPGGGAEGNGQGGAGES